MGDASESRSSWLDRISGAMGDAFRWLSGTYSGNDGYFDEDTGEFVARTCFVAGTLVATPEGYRPIETLNIGDEVYSWDELDGTIHSSPVTELFKNETTLLYEIDYSDGTSLQTTWNHPFYLKGRGWIQASDLSPGDRSLSMTRARDGTKLASNRLNYLHGSYRTIRSIRKFRRKKEPVYNIEVMGNHTYFVTESSILVHNYMDITKAAFADGMKSRGFKEQTAFDENGKRVKQFTKIEDGKLVVITMTNGKRGITVEEYAQNEDGSRGAMLDYRENAFVTRGSWVNPEGVLLTLEDYVFGSDKLLAL